MIHYGDIAKGVKEAITRMFGEVEVSDNPYDHLDGPAFIVKCVGSNHDRWSTKHAHRVYNFDCVYFPTVDTPMHEIDAEGQKLAEAFIFPLNFAGRYIQPKNIQTLKVDKDFHVTFDLEFYDELPQPDYSYMMELFMNFKLELSPTKE